MNNYFWFSGVCASLCAIIYILTANFEHFAPFKIGKLPKYDIIIWAFNVPFWLVALAGCLSFVAGCISNMT